MNPVAVHHLLSALASGEPRPVAELCLLSALDEHQCHDYLTELACDWRRCKDHGLQLVNPLDLLDASNVRKAYLDASTRGDAQLSLASITSSTNSDLMSMSAPAGDTAQIRFAEYQTAGRGRRERAWVMPYAAGLAMSLRRGFAAPLADLSGLSLVAGVAVARWLRELSGQAIGLKWPNDLVLEDGRGLHKLGGILVETLGRAEGTTVVTGIGLNYRLSAAQLQGMDQPIAQLADCLSAKAKTAKPLTRSQLAGGLAAAVETAYCQFALRGFADFREQWAQLDVLHHRDIRFFSEGQEATGLCMGIDAKGNLLVEVAGRMQSLTSADVSVRLLT